jgi:hypothetical protein
MLFFILSYFGHVKTESFETVVKRSLFFKIRRGSKCAECEADKESVDEVSKITQNSQNPKVT